jgi:hypothetical protein
MGTVNQAVPRGAKAVKEWMAVRAEVPLARVEEVAMVAMAAKVALVTRAAKEGMPGRVVQAEVAVRPVVQAGAQAKAEQVVKVLNRELRKRGVK